MKTQAAPRHCKKPMELKSSFWSSYYGASYYGFQCRKCGRYLVIEGRWDDFEEEEED